MDSYIANFQTRELVTPRYLDSNFFNQSQLGVFALLNRWKLIKFLTIKDKVYPELVKVFYSNLKYKDACLFSKVKKVHIVIDMGLFHQLTGLTFERETLPGKDTTLDDWKDDYNHDLALAQFIGEGGTTNKRTLVGILCLEDCILYYILVRVLIPTADNYA